jgi:glutathione peroxidase
MEPNLYSFKVKAADQKEVSLGNYKNQVVLIVNVASKCGYTPQYQGLEELYQKYKGRGLVILGFPCNQFQGQEPGSDQEIQQFCSLTYNVTFPIMAKIEVNGGEAAPLYKWLKSSAPGVLGTEAIKWNFTKFLVGKDGGAVTRFATITKPKSLEESIEKLL